MSASKSAAVAQMPSARDAACTCPSAARSFASHASIPSRSSKRIVFPPSLHTRIPICTNAGSRSCASCISSIATGKSRRMPTRMELIFTHDKVMWFTFSEVGQHCVSKVSAFTVRFSFSASVALLSTESSELWDESDKLQYAASSTSMRISHLLLGNMYSNKPDTKRRTPLAWSFFPSRRPMSPLRPIALASVFLKRSWWSSVKGS